MRITSARGRPLALGRDVGAAPFGFFEGVDFVFSCSPRIRPSRSRRLRNHATLHFDHSLQNT